MSTIKNLGSQTGVTILNGGERFVIDSEVLFQKFYLIDRYICQLQLG